MHPHQWMLRIHHVLLDPRDPQDGGADEDQDDVNADDLFDEGDDEGDGEDLDEGDGEDLDEGDDGEGDDEPSQRQPTRGENRVARATREAAEAKRKAEDLEREIAQLRQQRQAPTQPQETAEQRNARLAAMDPFERLEYLHRETQAATQAQMAAMQFKLDDQTDKAAYDSLCARTPVAEKYRKDVEERLAQMRAGGTTAPRETVLRWVIGDKALADAGRATGRARKTADANRQRQTARPPAGRGDSQGGEGRRGGDSPDARMRRLENMKI